MEKRDKKYKEHVGILKRLKIDEDELPTDKIKLEAFIGFNI